MNGVEYTPHDGDVTGSGCSASYRQNHKKLFLKDEKICTKCMYTLYFR